MATAKDYSSMSEDQLSQAFDQRNSSTALDYDTYVQFHDNNSGWAFNDKTSNFFTKWIYNTFQNPSMKEQYQRYLQDFSSKKDNELALISDELARRHDDAMSNNAYRRAYADILATGLNPRLLLEKGGFSGASVPQVSPSYKSSSSRSISDSLSYSESKSETFNKSAIIALMAVVLKVLLA